MKKHFAILLILTILTSLLAGCASSTPVEQPSNPSVSDQPEVPDTQPADEPDNAEGEIAPLETMDVVLYLPNEQADGFDTVEETVGATPQGITDALIAHDALPKNTIVNDFQLDTDGVETRDGDVVSYTPGDPCNINLDVSKAFGEALSSTGTAGESMLLGSLVNTMLEAYNADTITLTCDGAVIETGHNVYDEPLSFFELTPAAE